MLTTLKFEISVEIFPDVNRQTKAKARSDLSMVCAETGADMGLQP